MSTRHQPSIQGRRFSYDLSETTKTRLGVGDSVGDIFFYKKRLSRKTLKALLLHHGDPYGTRTRVAGVRGQRPRPLDEGAMNERQFLYDGPPFVNIKRKNSAVTEKLAG